jgi:hypothetical protein
MASPFFVVVTVPCRSAVSLRQGTASFASLNGKVSTIDAGMAALAPYSKICSTDLTGPNGPEQFYFLCTDKNPG